MRRYLRALTLCAVFAVFSGLYVYNKLFDSDMSVGRNGARRIFIPPRVSGARRGAADKTGPQSPLWYNRWVRYSPHITAFSTEGVETHAGIYMEDSDAAKTHYKALTVCSNIQNNKYNDARLGQV